MKITIEPSIPEPPYQKFTVDTLTNHDTTTELVDTLLNALRFAGYDQGNINLAAEKYAEDNRTETYEK